MYLNIKDNAFEFIESTTNHLDWILDNDPYYELEETTRYLKHLILSLSSASELLIKIYLSDINELLIYENVNEKVLNYYKSNNEMSLYDYIVYKDIDVETSNFKTCIDKLFFVTDLPLKYKKSLNNLRILRNKFIHFGINSNEEYYKLLFVIRNVYELLTNCEPFNKILIDYISDDPTKDLEIYSNYSLEVVIDKLWAEKYNPEIQVIFNEFYSVFNNSKFKFASMLPDVDEVRFSLAFIEFSDKELVDLDLALWVHNYPEENVLTIESSFKHGPILAVIPIQEGSKDREVYYAKSVEDIEVDDISSYEKFWEKKGILGDSYIKAKLGQQSINKIIKLIEDYFNSLGELEFK